MSEPLMQPSMRLTKLERNKIHQTIAETGLNPNECELKVADNRAIVTHESGSIFQFTITLSHGRGSGDLIRRIYVVRAAVEDGTRREFTTDSSVNEITGPLHAWASEVKQVTESPDLWAELQASRELITDIQQTDSGNTPFTQDEQRQIAAQLQEITKRLKQQFELTKDQAERIDEWREEVVEASTRMGQKDWLIYLLGTITALTIAATVPAGLGEHIFTMVIHALGYLFTGGSEPPQILG
jgi:hypothetical protein